MNLEKLEGTKIKSLIDKKNLYLTKGLNEK